MTVLPSLPTGLRTPLGKDNPRRLMKLASAKTKTSRRQSHKFNSYYYTIVKFSVPFPASESSDYANVAAKANRRNTYKKDLRSSAVSARMASIIPENLRYLW